MVEFTPAQLIFTLSYKSDRLIFDRLEKRFGTYDFQTLFEYILTDRGSEFGDPESLETGFTGIQRTSIYYCAPMRSGQKGGLEQAHTMLRMILPKKTNFEFLTQWDVRLEVNFSHFLNVAGGI